MPTDAGTAVAKVFWPWLLVMPRLLKAGEQDLNMDVETDIMNRSITLLRLSFLLLIYNGLVSCGSSRKSIGVEEGWELLSETKVNFVRDKDEINIDSRNQFTAIRFKVEDRDIRINDIRIIFQNGDQLNPNIDDEIQADQYSRIIELARDGRYIDRIEFKYRTTGNLLKGRANVLLFGKRYYPGY